MTPEAYRRLMALFDQACDLPPQAQRDLVAGLRDAEPDLADRLAHMLDADADDDAVLDAGLGAVDAPGMPERIGPYRVTALLGEGGMGVVYRAEQQSPQRTVAIKVLRAGLVTRRMVRRFLLEAEALARLDHPGIARVIEAAPDRDQAWIAIEYVQGVPITAWAERERLDDRGCVALAARVADAVHHAHLNGVVHRDLKPANVLVQPDGHPKVLDFGVARLAGGSGGTALTRAGEIVGTPSYMSPEQASLEPDRVDARSDVYALGVLAYRLLAGRLPIDLDGCTLHEMMHRIRQQAPVPLRHARPGVSGDLDTVLAKALHKDPDQRYASAAALADDLRRWLAHEPIAARPPSLGYQLSRFARRNRALTAVAVALLGAVVAGGSMSTLQWRRAERSLDTAEARRAAVVLLQARSELAHDPTSAVAWLQTLPDGAAWDRAWGVAWEAGARGVASDVLAGHTGPVRRVSWAAPGLVVTGAYDDTVRAWDLDARTVRVVAEHSADIKALAVLEAAPLRLIAADESGQVTSWSGGAGRLLVQPHDGTVNAMLPSPNGAAVATAGDDGAVWWRSVDEARARLLGTHTGPAEALAWSPDGAWVASGGADGKVAVVRANGTERSAFEAHPGGVAAVAFGREGLASAGADGAVRVWNPLTGVLLSETWGPGELREVAPLHDGGFAWTSRSGAVHAGRLVGAHAGVVRDLDVQGDQLATGGDDAQVRWWQLSTGASQRLLGHAAPVREVAFDPGGTRVASASEDGTVRIWPVPPPHAGVLATGSPDLRAVAWGPDGRIAAAGAGGELWLWDPVGGAVERLVGHTDEVEHLVWGARLVSAARDGSVRSWGPDTTRDAGAPVDRVALSAGGRWLAAATRALEVPLWDLHSGDKATLYGPTARVLDVAVSSEGTVAAGCADGTVWGWADRAGAQMVDLGDDVAWVAYGPGDRLAALAVDGTVVVIGEGDPWRGTAGPDPSPPAWSTAGELAWGTAEGTVVRWSGGALHTVGARRGAVTGVAWVGDVLASVHDDGMLRLWGPGARVREIPGPRGPLRAIAASRDAAWLAAVGDDGTVRRWPADPPDDPAEVRSLLEALTHARHDGEGLIAPWDLR